MVLGGGIPFFAPMEGRIDLELVETRSFGSRVVYMRYARRYVIGAPDRAP